MIAALSPRACSGPPSVAAWAAPALALALPVTPDCRLSGRHAYGPGMETFGVVRHALR